MHDIIIESEVKDNFKRKITISVFTQKNITSYHSKYLFSNLFYDKFTKLIALDTLQIVASPNWIEPFQQFYPSHFHQQGIAKTYYLINVTSRVSILWLSVQHFWLLFVECSIPVQNKKGYKNYFYDSSV